MVHLTTSARCFTGKPSAEFLPFRPRFRHELPETVPVQCNMPAWNARLAIALLVLLFSSSSSNDEEELLENSRKIPKIKNFLQMVHNLTDKVHLPFAKAMTKLKFKLHLVTDAMSTISPKWSQNELRKINIDVTSVMNFKNLREKVSTIFLLSEVSSFDIFWEDEEDTMIIIITDEELETALKDIATKNGWNNVYDLYILVPYNTSKKRSIDSIENVSCEDILPFTAKRAMGDKWMFKLHLINTLRPYNRHKVRKINIDINVVLNLANLYKKLQTIFPKLQGSNFDVAWKDKESEKSTKIYITIATKEELALALEEMYWRARENNKNFYDLYILFDYPGTI
ncbi:uncharacterized protein LOC105204117 [Solenopsis invicta]|uniref:uncharacterized protein LOC105204117 n=1 Tax=Solenopsis invicta TaxID=13686 RepID=UPI00193CD721|nr:uncharacterized protein LOC105204117 [Solenopsis invicta]